MPTIKMIVAAQGQEGPDLYFCKVECSYAQYDNGDYYDRAKEIAK